MVMKLENPDPAADQKSIIHLLKKKMMGLNLSSQSPMIVDVPNKRKKREHRNKKFKKQSRQHSKRVSADDLCLEDFVNEFVNFYSDGLPSAAASASSSSSSVGDQCDYEELVLDPQLDMFSFLDQTLTF